jgi:type III secretion protein L
MAFWLGVGQLEADFEHGVIAREEFAPLTSLLEAAAAARREIEVNRSMARVQAQQMIEAATAECRKIHEEAQRMYDTAFGRGYESGMRKASTDWTERAVLHADTDRIACERKSERMAELVMSAVRRIVETEDTQALYKRAVRTVIKSVGEVPMLTMRVSAGEREKARLAISQVVAQLNCRTPIDVVADTAIRVGACMFESDQGTIDASLDTQLDAIRRAIGRAVRRATTEDGANAPLIGDAREHAEMDTSDRAA